jgi:RecA-family ATPase
MIAHAYDDDARRRRQQENAERKRQEREDASPNGSYGIREEVYKQQSEAGNGQDHGRRSAINPIRWADIPEEAPPRRGFIVQDWLPVPCLSSIYGAPGVGKSLLAQQLLTCIVAGQPFFGSEVAQSPVLGLFCEDDDQELKWRQWHLNGHFGLTFARLAGLGYHIQGRAGLDSTLGLWSKTGPPEPQEFYGRVIEFARTERVRVLMLDNRAQVFMTDENDRAQSTWAGNLCAGIAREIDGSVIMVGHTAKSEGSEFSGSTGWDAVNRCRAWLRKADDDSGNLILSRQKANYAAPAEIILTLRDHVFRPVEPTLMTYADQLAVQKRLGAARQAFLDGLDIRNAQGRPLSHSPQAKNFAPRVLANDTFTVGELRAAMEDLFARGQIFAGVKLGTSKKSRKPFYGIARWTAEPLDDGAE